MAMVLDATRPPTIYKYEPPSDRAIKNLDESAIYFGSPKNFNDPFDCAIETQIENDPKGFTEWLTNCMKGVPIERVSPETIDRLRMIFVDKTNNAIATIANNIGVTCFSEFGSNLLMWAHYACKFTGFCIEFGTDTHPFAGIKRVTYQSNLPTFTVKELTNLSNEIPAAMSLFLTKSIDWQYEGEWRAIKQRGCSAMTYTSEAVRGIYFGPKIEGELKERIVKITQRRYPSAKLFQGRISKTEFKVNFDSI